MQIKIHINHIYIISQPLITDAMTAAEELESSNPLNFSQFEINLDEEESTE